MRKGRSSRLVPTSGPAPEALSATFLGSYTL
jgi:hypothetical protein